LGARKSDTVEVEVEVEVIQRHQECF